MTNSSFKGILSFLPKLDAGQLRNGLIGLEKESLRVAPEGGISQRAHPLALGSALTHPWVTTDYSEALLELVTPPFANFQDTLSFLDDLHGYVYQRLEDDEILWATSMPCVLAGGGNIPVARYGDSNAARMKTLYRVGLGHRYGRVMQVIAGVHFNYSLPETFWPQYRERAESDASERELRDEAYMGLVRNLQRVAWLIPYLFGASPAVCKSFFEGKKSNLDSFDATTFYEPHATSLRMGDIGYQNRREAGLGVKADYSSLAAYVASLRSAITTPAEAWERLGVRDASGEYLQLNANLLQIENEYYSTVRPKPLAEGLEPPSLSLHRRGIQYVELRSLDVNAYRPLGVNETQMRFLELMMLGCALADSPGIGLQERWEIDSNLEGTAHRGREPDFQLARNGQLVTLREWGLELFEVFEALAGKLDGEDGTDYRKAVAFQREKLLDPDLTPSAIMLDEMRREHEGFYQFARRLSHRHNEYFANRALSAERVAQFDAATDRSIREQREMEAADDQTFQAFLDAYNGQLKAFD